jgi:hypothetical protein
LWHAWQHCWACRWRPASSCTPRARAPGEAEPHSRMDVVTLLIVASLLSLGTPWGERSAAAQRQEQED